MVSLLPDENVFSVFGEMAYPRFSKKYFPHRLLETRTFPRTSHHVSVIWIKRFSVIFIINIDSSIFYPANRSWLDHFQVVRHMSHISIFRFISLLHLANDQNLELIQGDDCGDFSVHNPSLLYAYCAFSASRGS